MTKPNEATLQCSNCGTPNVAAMRQIIDADNDPQGKAALLSGRINAFNCQSCGTNNVVSAPLLYHDASKELLIAFVPMDVAMRRNINEEQMIGELMNALTSSIPKESFKAYMFHPKRALTMQGLIEQVMESDGVTKEMIQEQKDRVALIESFLEAKSEDALLALIQKHDDSIDMKTFQTLSMIAQRVAEQGQQDVLNHLAMIQDILLAQSSFGKELAEKRQQQEIIIREVSQEIEALGESAHHGDLLELIIKYIDDEERIQALVGLIRPALDYQFFMFFSEYIGKAPADERDALMVLRDTLQKFTEQIDEQMQAVLQQKAQFLQALVNSPEYEALLQQNMELVDDNFMGVLTANIQEAQRREDQQAAAKLQQIYETCVNLLQSQMTPELRFINDLLSSEDLATVQALIDERAGEFGGELLEVVDAVEQLFVSQGQNDAVQRLRGIRTALEATLT